MVYIKRVKRVPDKENAIFEATLAILVERGFHDITVSKIALKADISIGAIYHHFENKQDVINKLYIRTRKRFSERIFADFDFSMPFKEGFHILWLRTAQYWFEYPNEGIFLSTCDTIKFVNEKIQKEGREMLQPFVDFWERGIKEGMLKETSSPLIYAFSLYPISYLLRAQSTNGIKFNKEELEEIFELAWDSVAKH